MPLFEYSEWDGSQEFQPQSADKAFDQLTEYLLQYGDQVMRQLDDLDDEDQADIVKKLQQEGYIEEDGEGKFVVAPKGLRRIQENALTDLFQTFQRDSVGKHDTPQKGGGSVVLEDSKPYVYGDSLANLNLHETLKNAMVRQGGRHSDPPAAGRLRRLRDRVSDELPYRRADRHERLDEPLRQVLHDEEDCAWRSRRWSRPSTPRTSCRWSASTPTRTS